MAHHGCAMFVASKLISFLFRQKWSMAYRGDGELMLALLTNNGAKHMNDDFKYGFLDTRHQLSLSELLGVVVRQFLPNQFRS
jgi:hypothetical protein